MQVDMFADAAMPAQPAVASYQRRTHDVAPPDLFPTPPTLEWARRLARAPHGSRVAVFVSWLWAGEVVESLSEGAAGRWLLHKDGTVREIAPDAGAGVTWEKQDHDGRGAAVTQTDGAGFGRTVFLDPRRAEELHARHKMIRLGSGGTHAARYRFAAPGEAAPELLELPPAVGDCE